MDIRQVRQFVALCDTLSFSKAARALNMSQPPLSISIRKLEAEIGVALFDRHARGVTLTAAGIAALPHAREILRDMVAMGDAAGETIAEIGGRLNIGFVGSAVYALLPKVVPLFRSQRPTVDLRLREANTLEIMRGVETGDLDIGVLRTPVFDTGNVALEPLYREEMMLLIPPGHVLGDKTLVRLEDLREKALIGYDRVRNPNYRILLLSACEAAGFQPKIVEEAAHLHTLIALVESGIGLALAPAVSRIPGSNRICCARLTVQGAPIRIGLALAMRRGESRAITEAFAASLREAAGLLEGASGFGDRC